MEYRRYAGGDIVSEEDFHEYDNATPYYDDYAQIYIDDTNVNWDSIEHFEAWVHEAFKKAGY